MWRQRLGDWLPVAVTAVVVASLAAWAVVRVTRSDDQTEHHNLTHVHGLGMNPADGSLIVATHDGMYIVDRDDGALELIGETHQDTMGFTVVGPDHFLGSGHPDLAGRREGQPAQLGLIESTDAGATWAELSLGGEADFHALAAAGDSVYAWDAGTGRLMVSADQREWETRSTLDLAAFVVDPDEPSHLMAAMPAGLTESVDGGRTWRHADGPTAVALSWSATVGLWSADAEGTVWQRAGADWKQVSELRGLPQALLATAEGIYAAIQEADDSTRIIVSVDGGSTWQSLTP